METMLCLDDGCAFGLGAFETIAVENGRPCFLAEHLQRLEEALHFLRIACDHTMLQKAYFDDGLLYYQCPCAKKRMFLVFKITDEGYECETVDY